MNIERGQIYRVNLDPTIGSEQRGGARPCVILTITAFANKLRNVSVVPLTSSPRALPPLIVSVPSAGKAESMALCHQIRTIDKSRIGKCLGTMSPQDMATVEEGIRAVHGL
ncbi:MAG: type II toxin-antitoxin system PemK/MazF family toxin [Hydrogenophaga sp.]|nr:type II toxin-antitoxin system PemK/MazF family toxin [Hydrogenophaga sp.]